MLNLVKMELYRLARTPSLYVALFLIVVLVHFTVDGIKVNIADLQKEGQMSETALLEVGFSDGEESGDDVGGKTQNSDEYLADDGLEIGINTAPNEEWNEALNEGIPFSEFLDGFYSSGIVMLIVAIVIALYVAGEQKGGYVKNIIGQLPYRGQLALSKLVPVALEIFVLFATASLSMFVFANIYLKKYFVLGSFRDFMAVSGYHFLTHVAFGCLITFLAFLLRGASGAMVLGVLQSLDFFAMIYMKLDKWLNIKVSNYMLSTNMHTMVLDSGSKLIWRGVVVAVVFLMASLALSALVLQKRDIR